jgi:hypothetical protein
MAHLACVVPAGHVVDRVQQVHGVSFYYSPPPRAAVPYAAALKSHTDRSAARHTCPMCQLV